MQYMEEKGEDVCLYVHDKTIAIFIYMWFTPHREDGS